jgi:putative transposase
MRKDLIEVEKQNTKIAKYWCRIRVKGRKNFWVAVKPHQDIPEDANFCESKILKKGNDFFVYLTIEKEIKIIREYNDVLAIDFGIRHIASVVQMSTYKPTFYGRELREVRGHYFYLRKKLGKKKALETIRKIGRKEYRIVNDYLHKISREIVEQAIKTNSLIVFGDLRDIRKQNKGRRFNRKLNSFPYFKLAQYIKYKAGWEGIKVMEVSEAYTSQICHRCGEKGIRNNGLFRCECGLEDNSDRNGAINIGKRALGYISKVGDVSEPSLNSTEMIEPLKVKVQDLAGSHPYL